MDKDEIRQKVLDELTALQKEFNIPQVEIDKALLQFEDLIPLLQDKDDLLQQLADDLIDSVKYRANIGIPDTIPDDMIVENIAQEETTNNTFEVSTKGDDFGKQFSALNATFKEGPYAGRTIEDVWQNEIKKSGKGKPPSKDSILFGKDYQVSKDEYQKLWQMWANENPELIKQLKAKVNEGFTLVDSFAGDPNKTVNQAEALTNIINTNEFPLKKIISGMQKNVDQYGIEAAKVLGLDYGGTVNKGFKVVPEGSNSPNFQEFVDSGKWEEIESQYYPDRTKANAQNADGTVWFGKGDSPGFNATKREVGNKPWIENPTDVELRQWIIDNNIQTLNVAGNRSYGTEEIGQEAMNTIIKAVDPNKLPKESGSLSTAKFTDDFFDPDVGKITSLPDNHIFVFGSNTAGRHGKGAALDAKNNFGAITGQGYGLQGQSFAIPTKDGDLNVLDNKQIQGYIDKFFEFAKNNPDKTFVFTDIGTGLAGKNANEITSMLSNKPDNVILSKRFSGGGSLGAAKKDDPNIFPEKLDETYNEDVHTDFKRNILNQFSPEENKILNAFNNHPVVKEANLNGESVLLGLYKHFGPKFVEKYNNIKDMNIGTKAVLGTAGLAVKGQIKFAGLLIKMLRVLDPVGEGIELASKIATKKGVVKAGSFIAKKGTKAGSNIRYELINQAIWQSSAAIVAGVENGAMALNSVLDKYGLFPQALKDAGVEIVPYQDVMKTAADNYRYWQSGAWQASKTTSLWYLFDTAIPSIVSGSSIPNKAQWYIQGQLVPPLFNEKEGILNKLSEEDKDFYDIVMGIDTAKTRADKDKWYHVLPGFSLSSGWLQNEMEQTGTMHRTSTYSQRNNPELNEFQTDSHVSVYNRMEKLQNRFGSDIIPYAKEAIQYWDNTINESK